ncbi:hypothetical protein Vafri_6538, partial [Volvox africanus]
SKHTCTSIYAYYYPQTALTEFIDNFKQQVSKAWGIPVSQIVVTGIAVNNQSTTAVRRRRLISRTEEVGDLDETAVVNNDEAAVRRVLLTDDSPVIRALRSLGLTSLEQLGDPQPMSHVAVWSIRDREQRLMRELLMLSVESSDDQGEAVDGLSQHHQRHERSLQQSTSSNDTVSVNFSVTTLVEVPLPPSPPPRPPNPPGVVESPSPPPPPPRPPAPPPSPPMTAQVLASATGANVVQNPNPPSSPSSSTAGPPPPPNIPPPLPSLRQPPPRPPGNKNVSCSVLNGYELQNNMDHIGDNILVSYRNPGYQCTIRPNCLAYSGNTGQLKSRAFPLTPTTNQSCFYTKDASVIDAMGCGALAEAYSMTWGGGWGTAPTYIQNIYTSATCNIQLCLYYAEKYSLSIKNYIPSSLQAGWNQFSCNNVL